MNFLKMDEVWTTLSNQILDGQVTEIPSGYNYVVPKYLIVAKLCETLSERSTFEAITYFIDFLIANVSDEMAFFGISLAMREYNIAIATHPKFKEIGQKIMHVQPPVMSF